MRCNGKLSGNGELVKFLPICIKTELWRFKECHVLGQVLEWVKVHNLDGGISKCEVEKQKVVTNEMRCIRGR